MKITIIVFIALLAISAKANDTDAKIAKLESQIESLQAKLMSVYKSMIDETRSIRLSMIDIARTDQPAWCDFFDPNLSTCRDFNGLIFYVMPEKIESEGGGVKLTFSVGNIYAGEFAPLSISIAYNAEKKPRIGEMAPEKVIEEGERHKQKMADWQTKFKRAPGRWDKLAPSAWTRMSVFIPATSIDEFKWVEITIHTSGASLAKAR